MTEWLPQHSRTLAITLAGVCLLLVYLIGVHPLVQANVSLSEELDTLEDRWGRYARLAAALPDYEARMETLQGSRTSSDLVFREATIALSSAALQQRLTRAVNQAGATLLSIRIDPVSTGARLSRLPARAVFHADIERARDVVYQLEHATPYLFVTELSIRPATWSSAGETGDGRLEVSLELFGLLGVDNG
jgi:general secretion pathway protein M